MSLPQPKELLKSLAQAQDALVETLSAPIKQLASQLNLPPPPELPKATQFVETLPSLPPLPTPQLAPASAQASAGQQVYKREEIVKMKVVEEEVPKEEIKMKVV
jgi:hypothetical protein